MSIKALISGENKSKNKSNKKKWKALKSTKVNPAATASVKAATATATPALLSAATKLLRKPKKTTVAATASLAHVPPATVTELGLAADSHSFLN